VITDLKDTLRTIIIPFMARRITDVGIGVGEFRDFPCEEWGNSGDVPFDLEQRITTDAAAAQTAVGRLSAAGGNDGPESGIESLYQIATGEGRNAAGCGGDVVDPFDPDEDRIAGVADGTEGGVGFRDTSVRVVVHITDANTHANGEGSYPLGATREEAYDALADLDIQVLGLAVGLSGPFFGGFSSSATDDLREIAIETDALVPACAWNGSRPGACGASQCCTGPGGEGESTISGGMCPLVFAVDSGLFPGGSGGVPASIVSGIEALLGVRLFDITSSLRRDEDEFAETGFDTTCFINGVVPIRATPRGCAEAPTPFDSDGDDVDDSFRDVSPGSIVTFEVRAQNECVPETEEPQVFLVWIDLVASDGTGLGTKIVTILVPPRDPKLE
jgi:hypothetical protein